MKRSEFRKRVSQIGMQEGLMPAYLEEAAYFFAEEMGPAETYVKKAISLARRMQYSGLPSNNDVRDQDNGNNQIESQKTISKQDLITSDYLIGQIATWVESIRYELFNSNEIPFPKDIPSAVAWIKEEFNKPRPKDVQIKIERFKQEINKIEEMKKEGLIIGSYTLEREFLDYPGKEGWVESVPVSGRPKLEGLQRETKRIAKATGFREYAVTLHVLTGLKPMLPRFTIKAPLNPQVPSHFAITPDGGQLKRNYIQVEINAADLSPSELRGIYDKYRSGLNIEKSKTISKEQFRLYYLVKEKGGPPTAKGTTGFWRQVKDEWNAVPGNKIYKTWEGPYKAYKRIIEKLDKHYKEYHKERRKNAKFLQQVKDEWDAISGNEEYKTGKDRNKAYERIIEKINKYYKGS